MIESTSFSCAISTDYSTRFLNWRWFDSNDARIEIFFSLRGDFEEGRVVILLRECLTESNILSS